MNKHLTLLTAASVVAFVGATQALAGGPETAPAAVSHSHVNVSIEGIHARSNEFSSIVSVTNLTNASPPVHSTASPDELDAKSNWGWAFNLGYTFDDQSDFNVSYRNMKEKMNTATHAYSSVSQIISDSGTYTAVNLGSTGATSSIGLAGGNLYYAFLSATDTLTENAEVKYQQLNFDWGHTFKPAAGVYLHPFIGAAWRSIGYKDTVTYASVGAFTSATPTTTGGDYIQGSYSTTGDIQLNSTDVTELSTGAVITATGGTAEFAEANTTASGDGEFSTTNNSTYDVTNNAAALPSYTSKFSGFGPRVGIDSMYTFGENFGVVGGVAMTMPYAKLKVSGTATRFTTRNLPASGVGPTGAVIAATTGVNLQATTGTDTTTISSTDHKFIPEMEVKFGLRFANDITLDSDMAYYLEAGYRVIQDWSAVKNLNLRGTTTSTTDGVQTSLWGNAGPGYSYSDITNFGPYLKAGMTFGT